MYYCNKHNIVIDVEKTHNFRTNLTFLSLKSQVKTNFSYRLNGMKSNRSFGRDINETRIRFV